MNIQALKFMALAKCPACGSQNRRHLYVIKNSDVFECRACFLRYLDPCLHPDSMKDAYESEASLTSMNEFHEGYYEYGDLNTPSKTLSDFKRGLGLIERSAPQKGEIFDVGFGNGLFLAAAKKRGWHIRGIDSSASNLKVAKRKFDLDLENSDFESFEYSGEFSAITFWDVVEHFSDPNRAIQKASRMLMPGGVILIAVPNDSGLLPKLLSLFYGVGLKQMVNRFYLLEHVCYYNLKSLTAMMTRNGFRGTGHFLTNTDLKKYKLPLKDYFMAASVLGLGRLLGLENRLVAVYQKNSV